MEKDESKAPGGYARAAALSDERKREIARAGATARWGNRPVLATHRGNFEKDFGIEADCYVLNDEQKTAVMSQRGMAAALGFSKASSGTALKSLIGSKAIAKSSVGAELQKKVDNPLIFKDASVVGKGAQPRPVHGYDVTLLIDVCKAILEADSAGELANRPHLAAQARVILNASAKSGITGLVYALAGYDRTREEVITAFKTFVREEAREYEKEFPDQLYEEWYRLYQLPKPAQNKPWKFKHLTINHVYHPLAKSSGRVYELTQAQRATSKERHKKLHQFLSDIGVKALRQQLGQLLGIARISQTKNDYENYVEKLFGDQPDMFK